MHEPGLDTKTMQQDPNAVLLTAAAEALSAVNDEVRQRRNAERRLESIVAGVMQRLPMPIVVVDERSWVRACSQAARAHGLSPGSSIAPSGPLGEAVERLLGPVAAGDPDEVVVDGWHLVRLECDSMTGAQVLLWRDPADAEAAPPEADGLFGRFEPPWTVGSEPADVER